MSVLLSLKMRRNLFVDCELLFLLNQQLFSPPSLPPNRKFGQRGNDNFDRSCHHISFQKMAHQDHIHSLPLQHDWCEKFKDFFPLRRHITFSLKYFRKQKDGRYFK